MLPTFAFPSLVAGLVPELSLATDARAGVAATPFSALLQATMMPAPALTPAARDAALPTLPGNVVAGAPIAADTARSSTVLPPVFGTVEQPAVADEVAAAAGAPQPAGVAPAPPAGAAACQPAPPQPRAQDLPPARPDRAARQRLVPDAPIPQPIGAAPTPLQEVGGAAVGAPTELGEELDELENAPALPIEAGVQTQPFLPSPGVASTQPVLPLEAGPRQAALPVETAPTRPMLPAATKPPQPALPGLAQKSSPAPADRPTGPLASDAPPVQTMPAQPGSPAPATEPVPPAAPGALAELDPPISSGLPDASAAPIVTVVPTVAAPESVQQPVLVGLKPLAAPTSHETTAPRGKDSREHARPVPAASVVGFEANPRLLEAASDGSTQTLTSLPEEGAVQETAAAVGTLPETPTPAELRSELPVFSQEQAAPPAIRMAPVAAAQPGELPGFLPQLQATATFTGAEQVTARLFAHKAEEGGSRLTIELDPMELGGIEVSLQRDERGTASATFTVERPETLQLLQRDQRALVELLAGAGFTVDSGSLGFELRQEQQEAHQQHHPAAHHHARRGRGDGEGRPGTGPTPPTPSRGLLDLRV